MRTGWGQHHDMEQEWRTVPTACWRRARSIVADIASRSRSRVEKGDRHALTWSYSAVRRLDEGLRRDGIEPGFDRLIPVVVRARRPSRRPGCRRRCRFWPGMAVSMSC